ncbi:hypothetical protein IW262DRAFT_1454889 [Armillaria fumosa]|nr:hypothetical protein IW262DRAFT_1454889 [Armillaria fumosa]
MSDLPTTTDLLPSVWFRKQLDPRGRAHAIHKLSQLGLNYNRHRRCTISFPQLAFHNDPATVTIGLRMIFYILHRWWLDILHQDVSSFALPRSYSSLSPSQDHIKGKARAVLTPLLIGSNGSNSPCHPCLPDSILRSREPWWATQPKNTLDVTYVNYKSVLQEYGNYVLQRIEFVPTKPDARVPGINILKILQADDVIVDGDKAVNIDSDVVQLQYKDRQEKVQLRCHHTSITTHGLAYLMSTHIYQHLEAESDSWNDGHYIGNVAIAHLVSIFSVQPDIWVPEIAFVL